MSRQQALILAGMAAAVLVTIILLTWPYAPRPAVDAFPTALRCLAAPASSLMVGIGFIANRRFLDEAAIDGSDTSAVALAQRYLRNTLEQATLAALTWLLFATVMPDRAAAMLRALAVTFVVARAAFWIGYGISPWARAFGFALTFYPTVAVLVWSITALA